NSSAVLIEDNEILAGFEQERLDRIKSSSAPPQQAIDQCKFISKQSKIDSVAITHWFDSFSLDTVLSSKYAKGLQLSGEIISHSKTFTHHDAHAKSVQNFFNNNSDL